MSYKSYSLTQKLNRKFLRAIRWLTATRRRKIMSASLCILILFSSIASYITFKPKEAQAATLHWALNEGYGSTAHNANPPDGGGSGTSGPASPAGYDDGDHFNTWFNQTNAYSSNDQRASGQFQESGTTLYVSLSWNGSSFTSAKSTTLPTGGVGSETTNTLGGSSDTWGRTWSDSEFSDATFQVRLEDGVEDANDVDYKTFGLSIPAGATINGIEVAVEGYKVAPSPPLMPGETYVDHVTVTVYYETTASSLDGTITNAVWKTEDLCRTEKCLYFDGSGDYISLADNDDLDFAAAADFTLMGWFRHGTISTNPDYLVAKHESGTAGGYKVWMDADGDIAFGIDDDGTWGPEDVVGDDQSLNLDDNRWHHFAAVKDGTTGIYIYIDGILRDSDTSLTATGTLANAAPFYVGTDADGASNGWQGFIDEIKLHSEARSADQIKADFTAGAPEEGATASFGGDQSFLSDGLVGYWKMDDNASGNGQTIVDFSGNSNNGTTNDGANDTGMNCATSGKFGTGCDFDGTDDYVDVNANVNGGNQGTISFWMYMDSANTASWPNAASQTRTGSANTGMMIGQRSSSIGHFRLIDPTGGDHWVVVDTPAATLNIGKWVHVVGTWKVGEVLSIFVDGVEYKGSTKMQAAPKVAPGLYLGYNRENVLYLDGKLDEVRLYNRALSPAEVSALYNWAPGPTTYWKMDNPTTGSGQTIIDTSGNGVAGTTAGSGMDCTVQGKFGGACEFNGSDDRIDNFSTVLADNFSISEWVYFNSLTSEPFVFSEGPSYTTSHYIYVTNTGNVDFRVFATQVATSGNPISVGQWYHLEGTYDGTTATLYIDGVLAATGTGSKGSSSDRFTIGSKNTTGGGNFLDGKIDELKIYNYARTPSQIIEDMNAGHPAPGSPVGSAVGQWKFDEGYDTTAYDSGTGGNNLTLSTASWTNSGKFDKAWNGTGANWVAVSDSANHDFASGEDLSVSMWIKSDATANPGATEVLLNKHVPTNNPGYRLSYNTSGQLVCGIDDDTTSFPEDSATTTADYYDATWHHIVCVRNIAGDTLDLYVDGQLLAQDTDLSATGSLANADNLSVGDEDESDDGDEFFGDIDEVSIFRSALSSAQAKAEYNQGSQTTLGALSTNASGNADNSAERGYCPPGDSTASCAPVGDWKLDENTGTSAFDSSGNNNTLTLTNSPTFTPGSQGSAVNFVGSDAHLVRSAGDDDDFDFAAGESFSITTWIKHDTASAQQVILAKYAEAGYKLLMESDGDIRCALDYDSTWTPTDSALSVAGNFDDGNWHHVACVKSANTTLTLYIDGVVVTRDASLTNSTLENTDPLYIGIDSDASSLDWVGQIDNTKIFNYALSPAQIGWDFNRGGPRAWWKFDECTGTTANDSGIAASDLTIDAGDATGSNDSTGSCNSGNGNEMWDNGTNGKRNASLHFDGTNDIAYRNIANYRNTDSSGSITMWVKVGTPPSSPYTFFGSADTGTNAYYLLISEQTTGAVRVQQRNNDTLDQLTGAILINDNNWHHIAVVSDGADYYLYIDGKADTLTVNQGSNTGDWFSDTDNRDTITVGYLNRTTAEDYTTGQIDDVRVYSYPLTQQQINLVMNNGAVNFGPTEGSP